MAKHDIASKRKPYYTQIDNMLMMELNVYQFMLLSQYYRICSLPNAKSTIADKPLAEMCGMSPNKLKSTRKELERLGYITVTERFRETENGNREQLSYLVTVEDVQNKNFSYWESRNIVTGLPSDDTGVSHEVIEGLPSDDTALPHEMLPNNNKSNKTEEKESLSSTDDEPKNDSQESDATPESTHAENATPETAPKKKSSKKTDNRKKYGDVLFDGIREEICAHLNFPVAHKDCTASQNKVINKLREVFLSENFQLGDAKEYMHRLDKYYEQKGYPVEQYSYIKTDMLAKFAKVRQQRNATPQRTEPALQVLSKPADKQRLEELGLQTYDLEDMTDGTG